jgi:hypothetical protein
MRKIAGGGINKRALSFLRLLFSVKGKQGREDRAGRFKRLIALLLLLLLPLLTVAGQTPLNKKRKNLPAGIPVIWQDPGDIASLDLYYGPGRGAGGPKLPCKFIKEDSSGTSRKFYIEDSQGVRWKVKIGSEAKPETAAVRLLWAVGYFTDETYFLPEIKIKGMKQNGGRGLTINEDLVFNARVERISKQKKRHWRWFRNPFIGTKEFNGLRVMMALLNNWDVKTSNNRIDYYPKSGQFRYLVSDLGASFGRTGGVGRHTKGQPEHYAQSRFVKRHDLEQIDFVMSTRPTPILFVAYPFYPFMKNIMERKKVVEKIPIKDVRWVTQLLVQLSDEQIADAFRGAGFNPAEVNYLAGTVRNRIDQLIEITKVG